MVEQRDQDKDEYKIGLKLSHQMKNFLRRLLIIYSILCGSAAAIFIFMAVVSLDLSILLLIPVLIGFLVGISAPFVVPFTLLFNMIQYSQLKKNCKNYVRFKRTRLRIVKQTGTRFPIFNIEVPYTIISRVKRFDDEVFNELQRRSNLLHKLLRTYTPPHGSMNLQITGRENLILIYLKRNVKLRNRDLSNPWTRPSPIATKRVKLLIVDIEHGRHQEFLDRLDEEIIKAKVRMMEKKGRKLSDHPMLAKMPPI